MGNYLFNMYQISQMQRKYHSYVFSYGKILVFQTLAIKTLYFELSKPLLLTQTLESTCKIDLSRMCYFSIVRILKNIFLQDINSSRALIGTCWSKNKYRLLINPDWILTEIWPISRPSLLMNPFTSLLTTRELLRKLTSQNSKVSST